MAYLNQRSMNLIKQVAQQMLNGLDTNVYRVQMGEYDSFYGTTYFLFGAGNTLINRFGFYGNSNGEITSITIHGNNLFGYYNSLRSIKKVFCFDIDEINIDNGGTDTFIDIYIKPY